MIEALLPASVMVAEAYDDPPDAGLHPAEEPRVARAVAHRRREYTTGRHLARRCLARLGSPPAALVADENGAPQWPDGVVGSITHCRGYRAAVAARRTDLLAVGIDAEPDEPLPGGVRDLVTSATERRHLDELAAAAPGPSWDRALFSAKESVYKVWYPVQRRFLDFAGAELAFEPTGPDRAGFTARLADPIRVDGTDHLTLTGRCRFARGLVLTAIAVPVAVPAAP